MTAFRLMLTAQFARPVSSVCCEAQPAPFVATRALRVELVCYPNTYQLLGGVGQKREGEGEMRFLTSNMVAATVFVYVPLTTGAGFRGFLDVLLGELVALSLFASAFVVLLARLAAMPRDVMANT